jgi:hypothetical protein
VEGISFKGFSAANREATEANSRALSWYRCILVIVAICEWVAEVGFSGWNTIGMSNEGRIADELFTGFFHKTP